MIPRTLVPTDARLPAPNPSEAGGNRRPSALDERTLIPPALPLVALDGRSNIPASLPLDSIAARVIVPRDLKWDAIRQEAAVPVRAIPTQMDERVAVPSEAAPPQEIQFIEHVPADLVYPDVLTTGEVNLAPSAQKEKAAKWALLTRFSSGLVHALVILAIIFQPKMFSERSDRLTDSEIARQRMSYIFLPPSVKNVPKITNPNESRSDKMRIDPRILRKIAPPPPLPGPAEPERVVRDLPNAPTPQPEPPPKTEIARPVPRLEAPSEPTPQRGLVLPKISAGRAIEESAREASRSAGRTGAVSGPMPGGGSAPGGGGPSQGLLSNGYELLTPTEGVDFSNYMARVLASVRRNWYAVIPESARLGDRGRVILQFRILREGAVPNGEPALLATSGKEPLDRAAISAIRTSNPFEPLPPAFSGTYIELRFIFLYNLPIDYAQ